MRYQYRYPYGRERHYSISDSDRYLMTLLFLAALLVTAECWQPPTLSRKPALKARPLAAATTEDVVRTDLPKTVDLALAATGAGAACILLQVLEQQTGLRLYAPPLAASSVIIFSGITPPRAENVFLGTLGAALFALCLFEFGGVSTTSLEFGRAMAVAGSIVYFKQSGLLFPPAAAMACVYLDSPLMQESGWSYLLFPCLAGQLLLYLAAVSLSALRQSVRVAITRRQLDFSDATIESFRELFTRFDTSGDGLIDAMELKVALRALTGAELDISDTEKLVADADSDGDGVINFDEFLMLLQYDATALSSDSDAFKASSSSVEGP